MRLLCVTLVMMLAGCADIDPDLPPEPVQGSDGPRVIGVDNDLGRDAADAAARAWNPTARLLLVAAFQGDMEPFGDDRWPTAFRGADGDVRAGASTLWSYSYALEPPASDTIDSVFDAADRMPPRYGFVVFVDAEGEVVDSYETMDDDEGVPGIPWLSADVISSYQAAQALQGTGVERYAPYSTFSVMMLGEDLWDDGPAWIFTVETDTVASFAIVDGKTGVLLEAQTRDL